MGQLLVLFGCVLGAILGANSAGFLGLIGGFVLGGMLTYVSVALITIIFLMFTKD